MTTTAATATVTPSLLSVPNYNKFPQFPVQSYSLPRKPDHHLLLLCRSSKSPSTEPVKKRESKTKKKKKTSKEPETVKDFVVSEDDVVDGDGKGEASGFRPTPLPNPPAGFVLDDQGRILMASNKRLATVVDPTNNLPLECVIRRVFRSSKGDECMLLCPADTPVQILKSTNIDGWSAVSDEEIESILPAAAYALTKIHMHLVHSGFCFTARGGFCYSEDDIFDFHTDDGQIVDGLPTEGVEITCFHVDGAHYMIYTPSDPLLFVAVKDKHGQLQIADDVSTRFFLQMYQKKILGLSAKNALSLSCPMELLEDPSIVSAIDEETEFNALVEEEAALLESVMGER